MRYDFLWKAEATAGREHGRKDRPCAIILATKEDLKGNRQVVLCPITHSPPAPTQQAVPIPPKVAAHLGLDPDPSWIKTHEVNVVTWAKDQLPYGVSPVKNGVWSYGQLPQKLAAEAFEQVRFFAKRRRLKTTKRDKTTDIER